MIRFMHDIPGVKKRRAGIGPDMLALLSTAKCSLVLETPYMALSRKTKMVLRSLALSGVRVTILTNSFETNDHHSAQAIYENNKRRYLRWGINLWELRGCDYLHAKAAVIDGCVAVIGSYNFDELSQKKNSEVAVAIYDADVASMLLASINLHMERSYQIGRNAIPIGYNTKYPGIDRDTLHELRVQTDYCPLRETFSLGSTAMRSHPTPQWVRSLGCPVFLFALLASPLPGSGGDGQKDLPRPAAPSKDLARRAQPEVWLVSTRCLAGDESAFRFYRYDACGEPTASSLEAFLASADPQAPTVFYAHGAANSEPDALSGGWRAMPQFATETGRPLRFVIWSWPADRVHLRPVNDMRLQAGISYCEGLKMAQVIDRMAPQSPICLLGFSFGAQVTVGAAHVFGGGSLGGQTLANRLHPDRRLMRMVVVSAAMNNDWLMPGRPFDKAVIPLERMMVLFNPCDRGVEALSSDRPLRLCRSPGFLRDGSLGLPGCQRGQDRPGQVHSLGRVNGTNGSTTSTRALFISEFGLSPPSKTNRRILPSPTRRSVRNGLQRAYGLQGA